MNPTQPRIPVLDLQAEVEELWQPLNAAIQKVLRSGQFIMGPEVQLFEQEVAAFLGTPHAIALNSGTDALLIGLKALGVGPGDEVIVPAFTFFATAEAVGLLGATPVIVDVDPQSFNLDPQQVQAALTPRTKGIIPVHLYGNPAPLTPLLQLAQQHGLFVLEDCAQSFGAPYGPCQDCTCTPQPHWGQYTGTLGHVGAFSFFPSKNLGAYGDGGLLITANDQVAHLARMLRVHGAAKKYHNQMLGYNSRLDTLQAAILRVKLPHLPRYNQARREVAQRYQQALQNTPGLRLPPLSAGHVFHQYTVRVLNGQRDRVQQALAAQGIETMVYYPLALHQLPLYQPLGLHLPHSERLALEVLSLPIWPQMPLVTQERVIEALLHALDKPTK